MSNFVTKNNKKTFVATASRFLAGKAGKQALALADKYAGKVDQVEIGGEPRYKFTFGEMDNRDKFVKAFDRSYAKATAGKSKKEPKPTKPSSSAKKNSGKKMTLDEFIKANPLCTREQAKAYGFKGTRQDLREKKVALGVR